MTPEGLAELKADRNALLAALKDAGADVDGDAGHVRCPLHADATGSLSVFQAEGGWRWKCHTCNVGGDVADVLARTHGLSPAAAVKRALALYGNGRQTRTQAPARSSGPAFPNLDAAAARLCRQLKAEGGARG